MSVRVTPSASTAREKAPKAQQLLLCAGIIAPILFAIVFMIDGFLKPGYSAYSEAISYLEVGSNGWIQRANFLLIGLLLIAFLVGYISRMLPILGPGWLFAASTFLLLSDLGWIMACFFIPNTYLAPQFTWPWVLHQLAASTVFIPFALACIVLGAKFVGTRGWRAYGVYSLIFGLVSLIYPIGIVAYLFNPTAFGNVNSPNDGLINRIVLLLGPLAWYVITAVLALQHTDRTSDQV
jgi:Protein of unknown function (DUF998)